MRGAPATMDELRVAFERSAFDLSGMSFEYAITNPCLRAGLDLAVMIGRWSRREIERSRGEVTTTAQMAAAMYESGVMTFTTAPKWQRRMVDERRAAQGLGPLGENVLDFKRRAAGETERDFEEPLAEPLACDWKLPGAA